MDFKYYLHNFQKAADRLDKNILHEKQVQVAVGEVLNSVCLKLYKKSWTNAFEDPLTAETRIFFSVWINDSAIEEQKLLYNIHAFKLRRLQGYSIESKKFAEAFRNNFKNFEHKWENVSVKFGPLTLMEGWTRLNSSNLQWQVMELSNGFLGMEHLIDDTLAKFKK